MAICENLKSAIRREYQKMGKTLSDSELDVIGPVIPSVEAWR